ncbi:LysM peptidoglycan-binding domain-containing protein [Paludibaculum fermentans]|uniref:LysM peptidoglycan-binding domain-containing protein n=1 Tax=Paludibaculum fermentans TaxID=1473598 RepID=A0A7S7NQA0_PALFE|nr:LysM peptidoglycan-binding domain-containing protein [Paludibaculum fermentans]QOY87763.1 LysM peptidoglycan-binding domain-containing protein [Paludibaculum fermentans]
MADLDLLKAKYESVLQVIARRWVRLDHVHIQDEKLFIGAAAPTQDIKNEVWNAIKAVDEQFADLTADISVDASLPQPPPEPVIYTVVAGDSLWKIAADHLGNGANFHKLIEANPDKLKDEHSVIHPGDELVIPAI